MIAERELSADLDPKIFKPGNLVMGSTWSYIEPQIYDRGIKAAEWAEITNTGRPDVISASMLSTEPMPKRYLTRNNGGPTQYTDQRPAIAFIISLEKVLKKFPGQVFAVGEEFRNDSLWRQLSGIYHNRFPGYSRYGQFVSGIPVMRVPDAKFRGEVRIIPNDPENAVITPDMWEGIVTKNAVGLEQILKESHPSLKVRFIDLYDLTH